MNGSFNYSHKLSGRTGDGIIRESRGESEDGGEKEKGGERERG